MGNCHFIKTRDDEDDLNIYQTTFKQTLIIQTFTWQKESYGLFDYENKNITKRTIKTSKPGILQRIGDNIIIQHEQQDKNKNKNINFELLKQDTELQPKDLLQIQYAEGQFWILNKVDDKNNNNSDSDTVLTTSENEDIKDTSPWIVVRYFKNNQGWDLFKGDIIKLGRIKYKIYDINRQDKNNEKTNQNLDQDIAYDSQSKQSKKSKKKRKIKLCRICLSDSFDFTNGINENPFVNPCKCAGTMKYVHLKCLQIWLNGKMHTQQVSQNCTTYIWKLFQCELCKCKFPNTINASGKEYELYEIPKPTFHYLILEMINREKQQPKIYHLVNLSQKTQILIGRGTDNDFKLSDISISRMHAVIKYTPEGNLQLIDSNSKFGTLLLLKKPHAFKPMENMAVQVGRTLIQLQVTKGILNKVENCCRIKKPQKENKKSQQQEFIIDDDSYEDDDQDRLSNDEVIIINDNVQQQSQNAQSQQQSGQQQEENIQQSNQI